MDRLIYTAASAARATMQRQDSLTQNLANANTTGYRADQVAFRAVPVRGDGDSTRVVALEATAGFDSHSGPIQSTGRALDIALNGDGYIAVQSANGTEAYTRNGSLEVNANGILQTRSGLPVVGSGGPITVPPDVEVVVGGDGTLSAVPRTGARNNTTTVGQLKLVNPPEQDMRRGGDGYFRLADGNPAPADPAVRVASGYLEGSNVNVVEQMVTMISLARHYETQTKLLSVAQEMDRSASQLVAKS